MNILYIKTLVDKYFTAETSKDEERELLAYFSQCNIDDELLPYAPYFRRFIDEKKTKAPANATNKLKAAQKQTAQSARRKQYIRYISVGVAASMLVMLSANLGLFQNKIYDNDFVMYANGTRINDPAMAAEFTSQQFNKISATFSKTNGIVAKPINAIGQSLAPLRKTSAQLAKIEDVFKFED